MTTILTLQPPTGLDQRQPYPYHVTETGDVLRQDVWNGSPLRVIGLSHSPTPGSIDLTWSEAWATPAEAVGMFMVTEDADGDWSTHTTWVDHVATSTL